MRIVLAVIIALLAAQSPTPEAHRRQSAPPTVQSPKPPVPRAAKMKKGVFTKTAFFVPVDTQEPEPYPGQRNHENPPPPGWFCQRPAPGVPKAHHCWCDRKLRATPEDPSCCYAKREEIKKCTVWCWEDYCLCGTCEKPQSSQHHHP